MDGTSSRCRGEALSGWSGDRKSTRLNSSHSQISYAVFCLKKKHTAFFRRFLHIVPSRRALLTSILSLAGPLLSRASLIIINDNDLIEEKAPDDAKVIPSLY